MRMLFCIVLVDASKSIAMLLSNPKQTSTLKRTPPWYSQQHLPQYRQPEKIDQVKIQTYEHFGVWSTCSTYQIGWMLVMISFTLEHPCPGQDRYPRMSSLKVSRTNCTSKSLCKTVTLLVGIKTNLSCTFYINRWIIAYHVKGSKIIWLIIIRTNVNIHTTIKLS